MELLRSNESKITKDENSEYISHREITKVVLVHSNIVNNNYQENLRVLYTFIPNKLFGYLLDFFYLGFFLSRTFRIRAIPREAISFSPLYHFYPLYRHLDISRVITAERPPLLIASSRTRSRNLWFLSASR